MRRRPGVRVQEADVLIGQWMKLLGLTVDSSLELAPALRKDVQAKLAVARFEVDVLRRARPGVV